MEFKSIKEVLDKFYPTLTYKRASNENLLLSKCPFCGGKSAYINPVPTSNTFICHSGSCGERHGFMSLFNALAGTSYSRYTDVVNHLEGKSIEPKRETNKTKSRDTYGFSKNPTIGTKQIDLAPIGIRNKVYKRYLELLTLEIDDMNDLLRRGLTIEQIGRHGYKSVPDAKKAQEVISQMIEEGYRFAGVPGFYRVKQQVRVALGNGYYIPYIDVYGNIQGCQIRNKGDNNIVVNRTTLSLNKQKNKVRATVVVENNNHFGVPLKIEIKIADTVIISNNSHYDAEKQMITVKTKYLKPYEKFTYTYYLQYQNEPIRVYDADASIRTRYIWLSSGNTEEGTSAKSFFHIVGKVRPTIYLTEGALKANVAYELCQQKRSFLAVAGINNIMNLEQVLLYLRQNGTKTIAIAYDMDKIYNKQIREAIEKVSKLIALSGLEYTECFWDIELGKGVDDLMLNHVLRSV